MNVAAFQHFLIAAFLLLVFTTPAQAGFEMVDGGAYGESQSVPIQVKVKRQDAPEAITRIEPTTTQPAAIEPAAGAPESSYVGQAKTDQLLRRSPEQTNTVGTINAFPEGPGWIASPGLGVKEVLKSWSQEADIELVWMPETDFNVLQPLQMQGSYQSAVRALLNQYNRQETRLLGSLHFDDNRPRPVLVVKSADIDG